MKRLVTLMICAVSLGAAAQLPDYVPADGLVGWFPCDSSLLDLTGTFIAEEVAFDGFFEGAYGDTNGALGFDGESDFIRFEGNPVFGDSFSIGLWIKTEFGEHGPIVHVGRDDGDENNGFSLGIGGTTMNTPGDYLMAHFSGEGWFDVSSSVPYESWHHVCITWGSQLMTFYVQGDSVGSLSTTSSFTNPSNKLYLAAFSEAVYDKYGGALDQIGLWNRALSPAEVNQLFMWNPPAGCTEQTACNFDSGATIDDGSCHFLCQYCKAGTVWDDVLQGCIVANPSDSNFDGCVQLNDLLDLLSAYGDCVWQCGDPLEYQGYEYETVQIGEQCWFAENLRSEKYSTGDEITSNLSQNDWVGTIHGASCVYGEEQSPCENFSPTIEGCNPEESLEFYGRLYNWFAVTDERGLCPTGWHSPDDNEWQVLSAHLGGSATAGVNMKSTSGWREGGNGDNSSGFNGYPGGDRYAVDGEFYSSGNTGFWWSSTFLDNPQEPGAGFYYLEFGNGELKTSGYPPNNGMSVRCLKDTQ